MLELQKVTKTHSRSLKTSQTPAVIQRGEWAAVGMFPILSPTSSDYDNLIWKVDLYKKLREKRIIPLEMVG